MHIPVGEAFIIGIWYATIFAIAIAVWIIAIELVKISLTLSSIRQWLANLAITEASDGRVYETRPADRHGSSE